MNTNPYRPPTANVEPVAETAGPALHGAASMLLATFIGTPFAAAFLLWSNLVRLSLPRKAFLHVLILALFGAVTLYLAIEAPPDVISRSLLSIPFSLLSVSSYLAFLNYRGLLGRARRKRSLWQGVAAGVIARIAIAGLMMLFADFI